MKLATVIILFGWLGSVLAWQGSVSPDAVVPLAYPEGYRDWAHVKSALITPTSSRFGSVAGFTHTYANPEGMIGYRTRAFPEGAIVVVDWLEMQDNSGVYLEGPRRQVDVMVKDSRRFAKTGGWGFQRFVKDSKTELAATPAPQQCFSCHEKLKKDGLILGSYRQ